MVAVKVRRSVHTMASTYHSEDVRHLAKFTAMMLGVVDAVEKCCFSCSEDDVRGVWRMAWPMMEGERMASTYLLLVCLDDVAVVGSIYP